MSVDRPLNWDDARNRYLAETTACERDRIADLERRLAEAEAHAAYARKEALYALQKMSHWKCLVAQSEHDRAEAEAAHAADRELLRQALAALNRIRRAEYKGWSARATDPGDDNAYGYIERLKGYARTVLSSPEAKRAMEEQQ